MGLPTLTFASRERVGKANRLYQLTVKYIFKLAERDVGWSVENPSSSLMWITTPFVQLMDKLGAKCLGFLFSQLHVWFAAQKGDSHLDVYH